MAQRGETHAIGQHMIGARIQTHVVSPLQGSDTLVDHKPGALPRAVLLMARWAGELVAEFRRWTGA